MQPHLAAYESWSYKAVIALDEQLEIVRTYQTQFSLSLLSILCLLDFLSIPQSVDKPLHNLFLHRRVSQSSPAIMIL